MIKTIAPALRCLLENLIDYAGLFPPAGLPLQDVVQRYCQYEKSEHSWMLNRLVVPAKHVVDLDERVFGKLSVLAESDEPKASAIESTKIFRSQCPVYCEVALDCLDDLDAVQAANCYAKFRAGGLTPAAIPSPNTVAAFISRCAALRLPFKATAGLHHPVRSVQSLTYEPDAPRATMHGFVNVLLASCFAWHGEQNIEPILREDDPTAFSFDERAHWKNLSLSSSEVAAARTAFIHSIGSCSFEEPVHDLQKLGLL